MDLELFAIVISAGFSVGLLVWGMYSLNREITTLGEGGTVASDAGLLRVLAPYLSGFGTIVVRFFELMETPDDNPNFFKIYFWKFYQKFTLKAKTDLIHAGKDDFLGTTEVWGLCVVSAAGGFMTGLLFYANFGSWMVVAFPTLLFTILPFIWLTEQASTRQKRVARSLPFAIDMLSLMMRSGLDFTVGLERMVREMPAGPLNEEFSKVCQGLRVGNSREDSLRTLAERTGVVSVAIFTSAIIHSDRMGGDVNSVLEVQAQSLRTARFQTAEGEAAKAPVKMLLPLLLFIFPTIFLVLFGPLLCKYIGA